MAGESTAMKSWLFLDMGIHLGAGANWLGRKVRRPYRVLYVDEEMNSHVLHARVNRLARGAKLDLAGFRATSKHGVQMSRGMLEAFLKQLQAAGFDPEVVFIESVRATIEGDENRAQDVRAAVLNTNVLGHRTVVVSHHMTKPPDLIPGSTPRALIHRVSGSGDWRAASDAVLMASRPTAAARTKLEVGKARAGQNEGPVCWAEVVDVGPHDECREFDHRCPAIVRRYEPRAQAVPHGASQLAPQTKLFERPVELPQDT